CCLEVASMALVVSTGVFAFATFQEEKCLEIPKNRTVFLAVLLIWACFRTVTPCLLPGKF
ncbi:MAG: hypothetical protein KDD44_13845, partial [Bdellovibrionales bacterium]|nr:hypothetical protein [Bdellovibrionales bacterium]